MKIGSKLVLLMTRIELPKSLAIHAESPEVCQLSAPKEVNLRTDD